MEDETVWAEVDNDNRTASPLCRSEKWFEKGKECTEMTTVSADTIKVLLCFKSCVSVM